VGLEGGPEIGYGSERVSEVEAVERLSVTPWRERGQRDFLRVESASWAEQATARPERARKQATARPERARKQATARKPTLAGSWPLNMQRGYIQSYWAVICRGQDCWGSWKGNPPD
jgi:hypothetical protein